MNIENNFNNADVYLKMAKDNFSSQDYDSALSALGKVYSHISALMNQVSALKALKDEVTEQKGD